MLEFEFSSSMRGIHILGRQNTETNKIIENILLRTEHGGRVQHTAARNPLFKKNLGKNFRSFLVTVCRVRGACVLCAVRTVYR